MFRLFVLGACAVLVSASNGFAQARPVRLALDASWCWFGNPRALFKNGILHFGYVRNEDGRVALSYYDPLTAASSLLWLSEMAQRDDHGNPGLADLPDGRLLAIYAKHGIEPRFYYRLSTAVSNGPAIGWGPELVFTNMTSGATYANPYFLRAERSTVYNFLRNLNHNPTFVRSDESATNWSSPRILIRTGEGRTRPYVQYCSDYNRRVDFVYTDGHPLAVPNSLYHAFYRDGSFFRSDGTFLKYLRNAPIEHDRGERGTVIYQYDASPTQNPHEHIPGGRAWCWDLVYDKAETPVTVFSVQKTNVMGQDWTGDRLYYYYARWMETNWQKRFVAHAGRPLYATERDYAGGITIDPGNPAVIYISSNAADPFRTEVIDNVPLRTRARYEIFRGATSDGGLTFEWQTITRDSRVQPPPLCAAPESFPVRADVGCGSLRGLHKLAGGALRAFHDELRSREYAHSAVIVTVAS